MVKLYTVDEMIALEKEANASGLSYAEMMENAGKGIAEKVYSLYKHLEEKKVFALVGSGNNGGDALVALSYLASQNWETCAYITGNRATGDPLIARYQENMGKVILLKQDQDFKQLSKLLLSNSVCLDGIFGTGIKLPLRGGIEKVLGYIKNFLDTSYHHLRVVAVDCPSGVDCDTGEVAQGTFPAEITITMAGLKTGMTKFPAAGYCGDLHFASIGNIDNLNAYKANNKLVIDHDLIQKVIPKRPPDAHKGTFGTALIIAGSVNYTGAALLAGMAAYRVGAGLVTMAIPGILHSTLAGQFPEATWILLPEEFGVISAEAAKVVNENLNRATSVLVGPGLGLEDTSKEFIKRFINTTRDQRKGKIGFIQENKVIGERHTQDIPLVVDADALKSLSMIDDWYKSIHKETILTPHPGEMAVMTGLSVKEIQEDRIEMAKKYSQAWGQIVVLKGAFTVIAAPDGQVAILPIASAALARAGTGDVLAGLIVGLRAQGVSAFDAACAGAWIHASAGVLAGKRLGTTASVIASDVLNAVPEIMSEVG